MTKDIFTESPDLIQEVQKIQLEILKEFDRICRKNELPYHVYGGTLLGAVRHQGFIPWDDDIDVAMLRKDYEKFIEISKKELNRKYFLQTVETDSNTQVLFAKLRKNNTKYVEKNVSQLKMNHGIFIDIFPLDNVKNKQYNIYYKLTNFLYRIHMFLHKDKNQVSTKFVLLKKILDLVISNKLKIKFKKKISKMFQKYNNKNRDYVNHLTNGINEKRYNQFLISRNDFLNITSFSFEGIQVTGPKNYDKYLTQIYGEYMKLPPIEDRHSHHGIIELKL